MHTTRLISLVAVAAFTQVSAAQSGGPYTITAWTVDGGGISNASGGAFTLSGTVGQPDAGPTLSGGAFSVDGGFWPAAISITPCLADFNGDGFVNFFDISNFIAAYNIQSPAADISAPFGVWNFFDISAFIAAYNAGCP